MVATRRQRAAEQAIQDARRAEPAGEPERHDVAVLFDGEPHQLHTEHEKPRQGDRKTPKKKTSQGQGKAHEEASERKNKETESKNRQDFGSRRVVDVPRIRPGRQSEERALGPARRVMRRGFTTMCVAVLLPTFRGRAFLVVSMRRLGFLTTLWWLIFIYGHVLNPPPEKGSDSHACASTLGPYAFFTKQALTIQTSHLIVSCLAEFRVASGKLLALTHFFAPFAAVVAVSLTLLYLKLNWFEETWRREVWRPRNARGVRFTEITFVSHLPPLPVAILDCFLAKRPGVFPLDMRNVLNVALFASCYCALLRRLLTLMNYKLVGRYPYPFMRALKRRGTGSPSSWGCLYWRTS